MNSETVYICRWNDNGHGISQDEKTKPIIIPQSIVGETVCITPPHKSRKGLTSSITEIPKPSTHRIQPQCPHFSECGGCVWQHISYDHQLKIKEEKVRSLFTPLCSIPISPIINSPSVWHYRNKMEFSFSQDKSGNTFLGLHYRRSRVTNIHHCPITPPWMAETLNTVRTWWQTTNLTAYHPRSDSGTLLSLTLREGYTSKDKMIILTVSGNPNFAPSKHDLDCLVQCLTQNQGPLSIVLRIRQIAKGRPTQFYEMILHDPDFIREKLDIAIGSLEFHISPQSFFQPNTQTAMTVYSAALQMANLSPDATVLDLYCGIGIFGMFAALKAKKSIGIELNRDAAYDATTNAKRLGLGNFSILCGDVGEMIANKKLKPSTIIVDPPRAGLQKAIDQINALPASTLVYVSCNPISQAQDTAKLLASDWRVNVIQPIDQFPHTPHVENIIQFTRTK